MCRALLVHRLIRVAGAFNENFASWLRGASRVGFAMDLRGSSGCGKKRSRCNAALSATRSNRFA
jgi:hypothetical protein